MPPKAIRGAGGCARMAFGGMGAPTSAADFAETMKMPEPIIDPITIIVASSRLRPRTRCIGSADVRPTESISTYPFIDFVEELRFPVKTRGRYVNQTEISIAKRSKCW